MTKRIFHSICFVSLIVLAASVAIILGAVYGYYAGNQVSQLRTGVVLAAQAVEQDGLEYLTGLGDMDYRVTWIDSDGTVLYDSEETAADMENHLTREEVQEALRTGYGESERYSSTMTEELVYVAQLLSDGTVLRLSASRFTVATLALGISRSLCLVILVAVVLSLWLAHRLSQNIVKPLNELNLDEPLSGKGYEELRPLLARLDSQQRQLQGRDAQLRRQQREFDAVASNMAEGLVLINDTCSVLTMNPAAARIMGLSHPCVGIDFLTLDRAPVLEGAVRDALAGRHAECNVDLSGGVYQIDASPVRSGGKISGAAVLMFDITQKQYLESQRREFTANVSHELKTPLHAISGYAELLKDGMVSAPDIPGFSQKIYDESQRMIRLIEDILKLSSLDEGDENPAAEPIDLYRAAESQVAELKEMADGNHVTLILRGSSETVEGTPHLVDGILTNLITNAIKYNKPGGKVWVEVGRDENAITLAVSDTGIGIEPEHQSRVFERFYRVDKSRSKAAGGTGLGLSIVKHAAMVMGAKIELRSTPGLGTTVCVRFPVPHVST